MGRFSTPGDLPRLGFLILLFILVVVDLVVVLEVVFVFRILVGNVLESE